MFYNILNFLCVAFGFRWVFPYSKLRYGLLRVHSLRAPSHSPLKKKRRKGRKEEKEKGRKKKEEKKPDMKFLSVVWVLLIALIEMQ